MVPLLINPVRVAPKYSYFVCLSVIKLCNQGRESWSQSFSRIPVLWLRQTIMSMSCKVNNVILPRSLSIDCPHFTIQQCIPLYNLHLPSYFICFHTINHKSSLTHSFYWGKKPRPRQSKCLVCTTSQARIQIQDLEFCSNFVFLLHNQC